MDNYASVLAQGQALVPDYATEQLNRQLGQLRVKAAQEQITAAQQGRQRQQLYQSAVDGVLANPTANGFSNLIARFPEFKDEAKAAWDVRDEAQKTSDFRQMAEVQSLAKGGRYDEAAKAMRSRIAADKVAGEDTTHDEAIASALESGDPVQQRAALGMMTLTLASIAGPEHFGSIMDGLDKGQKPESKGVEAGGSIADRDPVTGEWKEAYRSPYLKGPNGELYERDPKGGDPVSGGGEAVTAQPRRSMGWTPRFRDGGDNPDAAVDNKVAAVAKAADLDPDAPLTREQAMNLPIDLNEGGAGSRADRNNNPGNIRNSDGSYKKFNTKDAGFAAQRSLLGRFYDRGQRSIRDIIEGRPVGGPRPAPAPSGDAPPGYRLVVPGKKTDYTPLSPAEAEARGLDPKKVYQLGPNGQVSAIGDAPGGGALGDATLTGEPYLATIPGNMRAAVKAIAEGRAAAPKPGTRYGQRLLEAVTQYDPTFDAANAPARFKTRQDFTSGKSAANITSFNTLLHHLDTLDHAVADLHNWSIPAINAVGNLANRAAGGSAVTNFRQARDAVAGEAVRAFRGVGGALADVEHAKSNLSENASPEQNRAAIQTLVNLLAGRIESLGEQYSAGMGVATDGVNLLDSKSREVFKRLTGENPSEGATSVGGAKNGAQPVTVKTPAEAQALSAGTLYRAPDGKLRRR